MSKPTNMKQLRAKHRAYLKPFYQEAERVFRAALDEDVEYTTSDRAKVRKWVRDSRDSLKVWARNNDCFEVIELAHLTARQDRALGPKKSWHKNGAK